MIEQQVTEFVAAADWTDDCKVRLTTRKRRETVMAPADARELAAQLVRAAEEAERAAARLARPTEVVAFDVAHISPDCSAGKCGACIGTAWDLDADGLTNCAHECHAPAEAAAA